MICVCESKEYACDRTHILRWLVQLLLDPTDHLSWSSSSFVMFNFWSLKRLSSSWLTFQAVDSGERSRNENDGALQELGFKWMSSDNPGLVLLKRIPWAEVKPIRLSVSPSPPAWRWSGTQLSPWNGTTKRKEKGWKLTNKKGKKGQWVRGEKGNLRPGVAICQSKHFSQILFHQQEGLDSSANDLVFSLSFLDQTPRLHTRCASWVWHLVGSGSCRLRRGLPLLPSAAGQCPGTWP